MIMNNSNHTEMLSVRLVMIFSLRHRFWPCGQASASKAADLGIIPAFAVDLFSFQFSVSFQDSIIALGKAHTRSAPSLSSLPKVAIETVPIFVWLNTDRPRPWRLECRPLPFSTPPYRQLILLCSGLSMFRKFLKISPAQWV